MLCIAVEHHGPRAHDLLVHPCNDVAAAAAYAGLIKAVGQGLVNSDDRIVVLSTGSGLKDVASAMKAVRAQPSVVEPTLDAVKEVLSA